MRVFGLSFLFLISFPTFLLGQSEREPRKKPILIREDPAKASEAEADQPFVPNARLAEEHFRIGNFYFKRDNYKAAEERFRDAVRNHPKWPEPYERLVRALEKQGEFIEAVKVCEDFVKANPTSKEVNRFLEWEKELKKRADGSK